MVVPDRLYLRIQRIPNRCSGVPEPSVCMQDLVPATLHATLYLPPPLAPTPLSPPCLLSTRQHPTATAQTSADPQCFLWSVTLLQSLQCVHLVQVINNSSSRLSGYLGSLCMSVADPDMLTSTSDLQNEKEQMQRAWSTDRRSACDALSHALMKGVMSSVLSEAQNAEDHAVKQV